MRVQPTPLNNGQPIQLNISPNNYSIPIPRQYYSEWIRLTFNFRMTLSAGPGTALPDGILALIRRVTLSFTHEIFGGISIVDMSGPALYALNESYEDYQPLVDVSPVLSGQNGTYDCVIRLMINAGMEKTAQRYRSQFLWDGPRMNNFDLLIQWGGQGGASPVDGSTVGLTAYGSGAGNPTLFVEYGQVLDMANNPHVGLMRRISNELALIPGGSFSSSQPGVIQTLNPGEAIRSILLRQYVVDTTAGQPTTQAASYLNPLNPGVDPGLNNIGLIVGQGNNFIRQWPSWQALQEDNKKFFRGTPPSGIGIIEMVTNGNPDQSLFTGDFTQKKIPLAIGGTVVTVANGRLEYVLNTVKANPQIKS